MLRDRVLDNGKKVQEKVVVTWSEKYAIREKKRRNGALDYASKLTNAELLRQTSKNGTKKYLEMQYLDKATGELKPFSPLITINYNKVSFDEQFDGINVLVSSETQMIDDEIIQNYNQLFKIEDCFRVTKTKFNTRPVYVRLKEHIEAHFLICFLALLIVRILQNKTNWTFSPKKLINAINSARSIELSTGVYKVSANEDLKEIFRLLNIEFDKDLVRYEDLKSFNRSWCTTKQKA